MASSVEDPTTAAPNEPAPAPADYLVDPNAVLNDVNAEWRYGIPPDYSKTREYFENTKTQTHPAGSLASLVENLVKNWEIEASFKTRLSDWRTIDHSSYTFSMNGGAAQTAEHMLEVGTYNAIVAANEFYSPKHSGFAESHKTFKRMMPTFAWEVLEVYSGPPVVAFRWRHWGVMKSDYVGFNDKGHKITARAHGGLIDIQGVTVATVDENVRVKKLETWFDPLEMFRQIAPGGIVNREPVSQKVGEETKEEVTNAAGSEKPRPEGGLSLTEIALSYVGPNTPSSSNVTVGSLLKGPTLYPDATVDETAHVPAGEKANGSQAPQDDIAAHLSQQADVVHPHPKTTENQVQPAEGEAVAAPANSAETKATHEEMNKASPAGCPFMNKE